MDSMEAIRSDFSRLLALRLSCKMYSQKYASAGNKQKAVGGHPWQVVATMSRNFYKSS